MEDPEHLRPVQPDQTVILIAEDDVIVQNVARIVLESAGYFILTADHGEDALYISRKYPGPVHLLLSDVKMPRMNGIELRQRILEERPSTKVLLMSGETQEATHGPFLRKPFSPDLLRSKVAELIHTTVLSHGETKLRRKPRPEEVG